MLSVILKAVANSNEKIDALENLFRTSGYLDAAKHEYMESAYCHYLSVKMGLQKEEKFPFLNKEKIVEDGGFKTGDAAIDALTSLIPTGDTEPTPSEPEETDPVETDPPEDNPADNPWETERETTDRSEIDQYYRPGAGWDSDPGSGVTPGIITDSDFFG